MTSERDWKSVGSIHFGIDFQCDLPRTHVIHSCADWRVFVQRDLSAQSPVARPFRGWPMGFGYGGQMPEPVKRTWNGEAKTTAARCGSVRSARDEVDRDDLRRQAWCWQAD
jgi:hypothetical protein